MSNLYGWTRREQAAGAGWTLRGEAGTAVLAPADDLVEVFAALSDQWLAETSSESSLTKRYAHPAYQRIVGLGPAAIPILLKELEAKPNYWFHALRSITGDDPVPPKMRGNLRAMTDAWLGW